MARVGGSGDRGGYERSAGAPCGLFQGPGTASRTRHAAGTGNTGDAAAVPVGSGQRAFRHRKSAVALWQQLLSSTQHTDMQVPDWAADFADVLFQTMGRHPRTLLHGDAAFDNAIVLEQGVGLVDFEIESGRATGCGPGTGHVAVGLGRRGYRVHHRIRGWPSGKSEHPVWFRPGRTSARPMIASAGCATTSANDINNDSATMRH